MDAIRKKMQSLKAETDGLYATIAKFEESTKEYNRMADQADCDIRDYGKKVSFLIYMITFMPLCKINCS